MAKPKNLLDEGEARGSEATFNMYIAQKCQRYLTGISYFITLQPYKKHKSYQRLQKIGPVYDRLRKKGFKNIFIVQETNGVGDKHYHALVTGAAGWQAWDSAGLKIHVARVGGDVARPDPPSREDIEHKEDRMIDDILNEVVESLSSEVEWLAKHRKLFNATVDLLCCCLKRQKDAAAKERLKQRRKLRKVELGGDVGRIVNYMLKEVGADLIPYENFIFE